MWHEKELEKLEVGQNSVARRMALNAPTLATIETRVVLIFENHILMIPAPSQLVPFHEKNMSVKISDPYSNIYW